MSPDMPVGMRIDIIDLADDGIRIRKFPADRSGFDLWFGGGSDSSESRAIAAMTVAREVLADD